MQLCCDDLIYYRHTFYFRTVAITGAPQLGWHTTLTTRSTPRPVSADFCKTHIKSDYLKLVSTFFISL